MCICARFVVKERSSPEFEKRMKYLPTRAKDSKGRLYLILIGAVLGFFLVLAFTAGPMLLDKFFLGDETGSIRGERLRPVR
jgi:hypothetical protein